MNAASPSSDPDPDLLLAVIDSSPDTAELLRWATVTKPLVDAGRVRWPLTDLDDLAPIFAAMRRAGLSQEDADRYLRSIPPEAFPVPTFEEFLRKTLVIIHLVHGLRDPNSDDRKMR